MSIKQFKFVSPGVFINEIDNSFLPDLPDKVGPVVIGGFSAVCAVQCYNGCRGVLPMSRAWCNDSWAGPQTIKKVHNNIDNGQHAEWENNSSISSPSSFPVARSTPGCCFGSLFDHLYF